MKSDLDMATRNQNAGRGRAAAAAVAQRPAPHADDLDQEDDLDIAPDDDVSAFIEDGEDDNPGDRRRDPLRRP